METRDFHYHGPETLEEAIALLARYGAGAVPLAGGTDLVPALKQGVLPARHLVSLGRIPGFREISMTPSGGLAIGAFATLRAVADSPLVRSSCKALAEAAAQAGSPLLRHRGTLGGNLCLDTRCWYYNQTEAWRASRPLCQKAGGERCYVNQKQNRCVALFSADTPAVLVAVGARVALAGPRGERTVPVEALYSGDGLAPLAKSAAEIVTLVTVPGSKGRRGTAYLKWSARESIDFPILGTAAAVSLGADGALDEVRVALTGVCSAPVRLAGFEAMLCGRAAPSPGDPALSEAVAGELGSLFLSDAVPHKRRVAGLLAVEAVARAAAAAGRLP
jgi:4-hydroxybenzoyl-CoA reductase subunit beta